MFNPKFGTVSGSGNTAASSPGKPAGPTTTTIQPPKSNPPYRPPGGSAAMRTSGAPSAEPPRHAIVPVSTDGGRPAAVDAIPPAAELPPLNWSSRVEFEGQLPSMLQDELACFLGSLDTAVTLISSQDLGRRDFIAYCSMRLARANLDLPVAYLKTLGRDIGGAIDAYRQVVAAAEQVAQRLDPNLDPRDDLAVDLWRANWWLRKAVDNLADRISTITGMKRLPGGDCSRVQVSKSELGPAIRRLAFMLRASLSTDLSNTSFLEKLCQAFRTLRVADYDLVEGLKAHGHHIGERFYRLDAAIEAARPREGAREGNHDAVPGLRREVEKSRSGAHGHLSLPSRNTAARRLKPPRHGITPGLCRAAHASPLDCVETARRKRHFCREQEGMFSPTFGTGSVNTAPSQGNTAQSPTSDPLQTTTTPPSRPVGGAAAMQTSGAPSAEPARQAIVPVPGGTHVAAASTLGTGLASRLAALSEILRDATSQSAPGGMVSFLTGRLGSFDLQSLARDLGRLGYDIGSEVTVFGLSLKNAKSVNDSGAKRLENLRNLFSATRMLDEKLAGVLRHAASAKPVAPPTKPAPLFEKTGASAAGAPARPALQDLDPQTRSAVVGLETIAAILLAKSGPGGVGTEGEANDVLNLIWFGAGGIIPEAGGIKLILENLKRSGVDIGELKQGINEIADDFQALEGIPTADTEKRQEALASFRDKMRSLAHTAERTARAARTGAGASKRTEVADRVGRLVAILDGLPKLDSAGLGRYGFAAGLRQEFSSLGLDALVVDLLAFGVDIRSTVQSIKELVDRAVDKAEERNRSKVKTPRLLAVQSRLLVELGMFGYRLKEIGKTLRAG